MNREISTFFNTLEENVGVTLRLKENTFVFDSWIISVESTPGIYLVVNKGQMPNVEQSVATIKSEMSRCC